MYPSVFTWGHPRASNEKFAEIIDAGKAKPFADGLKKLVGLADHLLCRLDLLSVDEIQQGAILILAEESAELLWTETAVLSDLIAGKEDVGVVLDEFFCLQKSGIVHRFGQDQGSVSGCRGDKIDDLFKSAFYDGIRIGCFLLGSACDEVEGGADILTGLAGVLGHVVERGKDVGAFIRLKGDRDLFEIGALSYDTMDAERGDQNEIACGNVCLAVIKAVANIALRDEMNLKKGVVMGAKIQGVLVFVAKRAEPQNTEWGVGRGGIHGHGDIQFVDRFDV